MSWVKRVNILLAGRDRLRETQKLLVQASRGNINLEARSNRHLIWLHLFEYYKMCHALRDGHNGTVKSMYNIDLNFKPIDFSDLIDAILQYPETFTFERYHADKN